MGLLHLVCFLAGAMHETALGFAPRTKSSFCGSNSNLGISGGHRVTIKDIPFIVAIGEVDAKDEVTAICAGTIIHERFILTAASCFGAATANRTILWGTSSLVDENLRELTGVEEKLCHEDYDAETLINDICLLKVEKALPFHWLVKADLPDEDFELEEGTLVNVTGWGATQSYLDTEEELRQVTVPVLSQECCDNVYEEFNDDQICAGRRRRDFCKGDMGGPLTINNMQVGVISGAGECGSGPGVYTRVSSYVDWIESTIDNNL